MIKIVKDFEMMTIPCELVVDTEEGRKIADILFKVLEHNNDGIGLAANQIGFKKSVCIVNVKRPLYFINPQIIGKTGEIILEEGCLSFPKRVVKTKRHRQILVRADNFEQDVLYGVKGDFGEDVLEAVCIQHEIDHLNGITMFDRRYEED